MNPRYGKVIKEIKPKVTLGFSQGFESIGILSTFLQIAPVLITFYIGSVSSLRWVAFFFTIVSFILLFILLREMYGRFRVPYSLEYIITEKGILYTWRDFGHKEFFTPYIIIGNVKLIKYSDSNKSKIFFQGSAHISSYQSSFLTDETNGLLCFNNLNHEEAKICYEILSKYISESEYEHIEEQNKIDYLFQYFKNDILNLLITPFISLAVFMALQLVDATLLGFEIVEEQVIGQKWIGTGSNATSKVFTSNDYSFATTITEKFENKSVSIGITPIFNKVIYYERDGKDFTQYLIKNLNGIPLIIKYLAMLSLIFSSIYLKFKKSEIELYDFIFFVVIPLSLVAVSYLFD